MGPNERQIAIPPTLQLLHYSINTKSLYLFGCTKQNTHNSSLAIERQWHLQVQLRNAWHVRRLYIL